MSKLLDQLRAIKHGKTQKLRGYNIRREGEFYEMEGESLSLEEISKKLDQIAPAAKGIDYDWTAFIECKPHSSKPVKIHRVKSKVEHTGLLAAIKKRHNYLYFGTVKKEKEKYYVSQPLILDWDSVPDHPKAAKVVDYDDDAEIDEVEEKGIDPARWDGGLSCPFCGQQMSSTQGRTLHVKSKHNDRFGEYLNLLQVSVTVPATKTTPDDDDDIVNRIDESNKLQCSVCGKKMSSTSGLTLHMKSKHPTGAI